MPPDVLSALNGGIANALQDGRLKAGFAKFGIAPCGTRVQEGAVFAREKYEIWRKVITDAPMGPD